MCRPLNAAGEQSKMAQARNWFVFAMAIITMFTTVGCESDAKNASQPAQPLPISARWNGSDSAFQQSGQWLINSQAELDATGSSHLGDLSVDFSNQSLIVLSLGERSTGGYWATITGAQQKGGKVYFQAVASRPGDDAATTQAFSYPVAAAVIPKVQPRVVIPEVESVTGGSPEDYNDLRMDEVSRWNSQAGE